MRLDLYQADTARIAAEQSALLAQAKAILQQGPWLRRVLRDLPAAQTVEAVEALLPWNLRIPDLLGKTAA